ncbi:MAG: hypothetical protein IJH39_04625 [Clostridia bacterium]|nr:hypothetical protein [Clostridia bacterium]
MAHEKFVRKHTTDEEAKEVFVRIENSRSTTQCKAEKTAIALYKQLARKLEEEAKKKD